MLSDDVAIINQDYDLYIFIYMCVCVCVCVLFIYIYYTNIRYCSNVFESFHIRK